MSIKKIISTIKKNKSFLVTSHINPEGDALGSEVSFFMLLKKLGKEAHIVNADLTPPEHAFLPGIANIKHLKGRLKDLDFDCFAILDSSDLRRCGEVAKLAEGKPTINIDHHISNEMFAGANWVDAKASSCSEMIYRLYKEMNMPIDKDVATLLYVGIMTDTGSFRYSNTTSKTHEIAADLIRYGLDVARLYKHAYGSVPFEDMKLLANILPTMKRASEGRVVWFELRRKMFKDKSIFFDINEHILNFARSIKGVEVAALFRENLKSKNEIRVNLRSQGNVDVNKIAGHFAGGGHRTASGCTVKGKLTDVKKRVLARIKAALAAV